MRQSKTACPFLACRGFCPLLPRRERFFRRYYMTTKEKELTLEVRGSYQDAGLEKVPTESVRVGGNWDAASAPWWICL